MARTRQLKPDFFLNEDLATIEPRARLLFAGLWLLADREGRLEDRPAKIKAQIFPYEDVDMEHLLLVLACGFITRYTAKGDRFIQIPAFKKHQHIHPDEKASLHPAPSKSQTVTRKFPGQPGNKKTRSEIMPLVLLSSTSSSPSSSPSNSSSPVIEPAAQTVEPIKKEPTPIQRVVEAYKVAKKVPMTDKGWDRQNFGRYSKAAKGLLECFKGDTKTAAAYIFGRAFDLDDKGLSWTLETIARNAWDGEGLQKQGESDGLNDGAVVADRLSGPGRNRRLTSAREVVGDTIRTITNARLLAEGTGHLGIDEPDFPDDGSDEP